MYKLSSTEVQNYSVQNYKSVPKKCNSAVGSFAVYAQRQRKISWLICNLVTLCFRSLGFHKVICLADFFIFNGSVIFQCVAIHGIFLATQNGRVACVYGLYIKTPLNRGSGGFKVYAQKVEIMCN